MIETGSVRERSGDEFAQGRALPDALAEDAVDKTLQPPRQPGRFQGVDGLVDGCGGGDAIKKKELKEPDLQGMEDEGLEPV